MVREVARILDLMDSLMKLRLFFALLLASAAHAAQPPDKPKEFIRANYTKREVRIPMRDGVKLFTAIYTPKDASKKCPILMMRTPYDVGPYGADKFKEMIGPNTHFLKEGYVFVYQDVRGCYMSEGKFVNMTPH